MENRLESFIRENPDEMFAAGEISAAEAERIEKELDVELTGEYRSFLLKFGFIMGYGVEILGCAKNGNSNMLEQTLRFRKQGLEKNYIVIRNADEWVYCLDLNTGSITSWDPIDKNHINEADGFYEYVVTELEEAKEEFDDDEM